VIREVANRLRRVPGLEPTLARLRFDDFGIRIADNDAQQAAQALQSAFEEPIQIGDAQIDVQCAMGASFYPGHGQDADSLLRRAAIAAREAARKDMQYQVYSGSTDRENPARLSLAAELRAAIAARELVLHYQPKVDLATGRVVGFEALIRWHHPRRGFLPPAQFVPLAEETGLIRKLTYLVLDEAVRQQHAWTKEGRARPIAVNLSARNLYDPGFIEVFEGLLETWGVRPELIEFEITEGALVDDPDTARKVLSTLRERGSKIYIDDFGTGYSSLNYLVTLPVHALKIDRSFVHQMTTSKEAYSVVASVISMAHNLDLRVVAEGTETEKDVALLKELGCDEAQGYYFGKPAPAAEAERLISGVAGTAASA
jgi:EAL domain-containing protein (putative c-di-GMP-specific phosphodiesterase class I)